MYNIDNYCNIYTIFWWKNGYNCWLFKGKKWNDYENLKAEFNNIYTNSLKNYNDKYDKLKSDTSKELVYTGYTKDVTENNSYNINVQIPYINIKNQL